MNKKTIITILYTASILLMAYGVYTQLTTTKGQINIFFWLGLIAYSIGALMKYSNKKEQ